MIESRVRVFKTISFLLKKLQFICLVAFLFSMPLRFYVHPSGGHTHRQSDTLGLSMRLAHEIKDRGFGALDFLWYPKILQGGLSNGINASEFPLLNLLSAPFFLLFDAQWGVALASSLVLLIQIGTALWTLPRLLRLFLLGVSPEELLLLWFSPLGLGWQSHLFMPEGLALPLLLLGLLFILGEPVRSKCFFLGVFLSALGMAVKPTVAVCFLIILLLPKASLKEKAVRSSLGAFSLLFPLFWYTVHGKTLLSLGDGPQVFMEAELKPIENWLQVGVLGFVTLVRQQIFSGGFPEFTGWIWILSALFFREWKWVTLYLLGIFLLVGLDGGHLFAHSYYFIGVNIFSLILMTRIYEVSQKKYPSLGLLLSLTLIFGVTYHTRTNIWTWARDSDYFRKNPYRLAKKVQFRIPDDYALVTDDTTYPAKLLYLNRIGLAGGDHPEEVCKNPSYGFKRIALLIDSSRELDLNLCANRKNTITEINDDQSAWKLVLLDPWKEDL